MFLPPPSFANFPFFFYLNEERRMHNIFSDQSQYPSLRNLSSYKAITAVVQYPSIFYPLLTHRKWIREGRWMTTQPSTKLHKNEILSNVFCKNILNAAKFLTLLHFLDSKSLLYVRDFKQFGIPKHLTPKKAFYTGHCRDCPYQFPRDIMHTSGPERFWQGVLVLGHR